MKKITAVILLLIAFVIVTIMPIVAFSQNVKTYIPKNAFQYLPVLNIETKKIFPKLIHCEYFGGLIEQESCLSLINPKCWQPTSELKTSREEGAGLSQITKAFNKDGSVRFDSLKDLRARHLRELKDLSWNNVIQRPDLQIAGLLLMSKDNYDIFFQVKDEVNRLKMTDSAYNSGPEAVKRRRLQCGLTKNCDPQIWDNNVGRMQVLSTKPIYGTRSANDINLEHVKYIFDYRMKKYKPYLACYQPSN